MKSVALPALLVLLAALFLPSIADAAGGGDAAYPEYGQHSKFPVPLGEYDDDHCESPWEKIKYRASVDPFNVVASVIFLLSLIHI